MITLTYETLNNGRFVKTLRKLSTLHGLDQRTAFRIGKIHQAVEKELKLAQNQFSRVIEKYAERDENGEMVPRKEGDREVPGSYVIPEDKTEAFEKEFDEYLKNEFVIQQFRVGLSDLKPVSLTAADLMALEPIFFDDTESEKPAVEKTESKLT